MGNSEGTVIRVILISAYANILYKPETANTPWQKQFAPFLKIPINHHVIYHESCLLLFWQCNCALVTKNENQKNPLKK